MKFSTVENDSLRQEKLQSQNVSLDNQDLPNVKVEEKKTLSEKPSYIEEKYSMINIVEFYLDGKTRTTSYFLVHQ